MCVYASFMYVAIASETLRMNLNFKLKKLNFVYRVAWTTCAYTQRTPDISPPYSLPTRFAFFCVSSLFCCPYCRPAVVDPIAFSYAKLVVPLFVLPLAAGDGILEVPCHVDSCGKFVFPSQYRPVLMFEVPCHMENSSSHLNYRPVLIFEVRCHVVNSSSHLITCHFPSWKSHLMW